MLNVLMTSVELTYAYEQEGMSDVTEEAKGTYYILKIHIIKESEHSKVSFKEA